MYLHSMVPIPAGIILRDEKRKNVASCGFSTGSFLFGLTRILEVKLTYPLGYTWPFIVHFLVENK